MTRERIEDFREVLLPFVKKWLLRINYENRGKSDVEEFEKDFNEILDLAIKALEQEPVIDKIRAEIKAASLGKWYVGRTDGKAEEVLLMADVLQILDKYKAESEEET